LEIQSKPSAPSLSRRRFTQLLGLGLAATAAGPPNALRSALAAPAVSPSDIASGIVRLSANENPYGPSPKAFAAMRAAFDLAWRYPDEGMDALVADLAHHHDVGVDHILLGNGSSEILKLCAAAFTGPGRPTVMADPAFEALAIYARAAGVEVIKVPLTADYQHDLARMQAAAGADQPAGLIYICNPNNPTATITPKDRLSAFLTGLPAGVTALVDEAYFHYAENPLYESVIPLAREHPNVIVARTFSKVYGMAGLRCGYAVARPETIERLRAQQIWDSVNAMALAAARAGLADGAHTAESRRRNSATRSSVTAELERMGYHVLPSATNFLMADLRRPVGPVIEALRQRRVQVGRVFPALPTHLRVTLGTPPQMQTFLAALRQVLA
jgi:histidinol-phosphate aminotransferase